MAAASDAPSCARARTARRSRSTTTDKRLLNLCRGSFPLAPAALRSASPPLAGHRRGRGAGARRSGCSTSGSSARSRRSSTRARSATRRCSSPPRSTPSTRGARPRSSTPTLASRTTTCATTSSTSGSRSPPSPTRCSASRARSRCSAARPGAESVRQLPTLKLFKIRMDLEMEGAPSLAGAAAASSRAETEPQPYDELDIAVIRAPRATCRSSPSPTRRPPASWAWARTSCSRTSRRMIERRLLRRVAAILFHRRAGFSANGMGVWKVPDDRVLETGRRMASFRGISHCYQRPTYQDWPYSVFTMAHGRSQGGVRRDPRRDRRGHRHRRAGDAVLVDRVQEGPAPLLHGRLQGLGTRPCLSAGRG